MRRYALHLPPGTALNCSIWRSRTACMSVVHVGVACAWAAAPATPALERSSSPHTLSMAGIRRSGWWPRFGGGSRCRATQRGGHPVCGVLAGTSRAGS